MRNVRLRNWIVLPAIFAFATLLGGIPARAAGGDHAADKRAIRDIVERHRVGLERRDVGEAIAFYAADAIVMPAGHPAARGTDAIRTFFASILKSPKIEVVFTSEKLDFSAAGDLAIEVGRVDFRTRDPAADFDARYLSKYIVVWRKADGAWQVVYDIWNADGQGPG